jgi:hypothetical protein
MHGTAGKTFDRVSMTWIDNAEFQRITADREERAFQRRSCQGQLAAPMAVIKDIEPYRSPVTGEYVGGKRQKRADLDRHGCVDAAELPRTTDGKFRNRKFAEKRGLTHLLKEDAK